MASLPDPREFACQDHRMTGTGVSPTRADEILLAHLEGDSTWSWEAADSLESIVRANGSDIQFLGLTRGPATALDVTFALGLIAITTSQTQEPLDADLDPDPGPIVETRTHRIRRCVGQVHWLADGDLPVAEVGTRSPYQSGLVAVDSTLFLRPVDGTALRCWGKVTAIRVAF